MTFKIIHIDETDSTNRWLRDHGQEPIRHDGTLASAGTAVVADYQTAGRGCGTNTWESERGKNLLFSLLIHPTDVPAREQFLLSMANALALKTALDSYVDDISIKWPNDIYWRDRKIGGTLIETRLQGTLVKDCIIGTGINVNQTQFLSDAPNPVSLAQILGHEVSRDALLQHILDAFRLSDDLPERYKAALYRREGFFTYRDSGGTFRAEWVDVERDGTLVLRDEGGTVRRYAFKQVAFVL